MTHHTGSLIDILWPTKLRNLWDFLREFVYFFYALLSCAISFFKLGSAGIYDAILQVVKLYSVSKVYSVSDESLGNALLDW